jgi:hypothetical protein
MLGERITRGKKGNGINPENRRIDEEAQRTQSRKKRNGIHTGARRAQRTQSRKKEPIA